MHQHTHTIALALSSGETTEDYRTFAQAVRDLAVSLHGGQFKIGFGMSDNCAAIRAAAKEVFPRIVWGNCWAHLQVRSCSPGLFPSTVPSIYVLPSGPSHPCPYTLLDTLSWIGLSPSHPPIIPCTDAFMRHFLPMVPLLSPYCPWSPGLWVVACVVPCTGPGLRNP